MKNAKNQSRMVSASDTRDTTRYQHGQVFFSCQNIIIFSERNRIGDVLEQTDVHT
jgi:hypothetical protein